MLLSVPIGKTWWAMNMAIPLPGPCLPQHCNVFFFKAIFFLVKQNWNHHFDWSNRVTPWRFSRGSLPNHTRFGYTAGHQTLQLAAGRQQPADHRLRCGAVDPQRWEDHRSIEAGGFSSHVWLAEGILSTWERSYSKLLTIVINLGPISQTGVQIPYP